MRKERGQYNLIKFKIIISLNVIKMATLMNTRNKGAIIQMKMLGQLFWDRLIDGDEAQTVGK